MTKLYPTIFFLLALFCSPTHAATYNRVDTNHFSFFYHPADKRIAEHLISRAEAARSDIAADLGVLDEAKTRVYIAGSRQEFRKLQPQDSKAPAWAGALAYPELNLILLNSPRTVKGLSQDILISFKHELTHILASKAFRGRKIPRWLNEGLAVYEAREWDTNRLTLMTRAVLTRSLIPLRKLIDDFPLDPKRAELAYSQSFYLVSYLLTKEGKPTFHQFIKQYSKDRDLEYVLREVYGLGLAELETEWQAHLRFRFSWLPLIFSATGTWFVITLIFLISYLKKKWANRLVLATWKEEEERDWQ